MKRLLKALFVAWITKKLFNRVARADDDADTARRSRR